MDSQFKFCFGIMLMCASIGLITAAVSTAAEGSCHPTARWISDAEVQRGGTMRCDGQQQMAVQTAMDGYIVLCSCK